ncbi:MAG: adenylyltransferase [Candidatus Binatia bacterium]|nr:MAG: adenylyltransferase [Candidatus Binatia bacterium]
METMPERARLQNASILIVGAGGLGLPAAQLLGARGVGRVTLLDPDTVSLSNLHRQLIFDEEDIGLPKAIVAARKLAKAFPATRYEGIPDALDERAAPSLIASHDWIIDATDGWQTKLRIHDMVLRRGRPLGHAGATGWRGQALTVLPDVPGCLRCLIEVSAAGPEVSCQQAGIVPGVVQLLGTRLAAEAVNWFLGRDDALLVRKLLYVDLSRPVVRVTRFEPLPRCEACAPRWHHAVAHRDAG